ncbi:hypothetical protein Tco_0102926 [Tanacetum coccineum]
MEGDSTFMGSSDSESLVGCGYGGGKFHGDSPCKNDSVDDSRLIEVKKVFCLNLTLLYDEAHEVLNMMTLKRGNLSPRYIGQFKVLARVGHVAYRLELPQELSSVHSTLHVSNLKKCLSDESLFIPLEEIQVYDKLHSSSNQWKLWIGKSNN